MKYRRLPREAQLDHFDDLVNAYALLAGHINRVAELELAIKCAYRQAVESNTAFSSLPSILGPAVKAPELAVSKAAWIGEHFFRARAFCVGNRIVTQRRSDFGSPIVDQVEELGFQSKKVRYKDLVSMAAPYLYNQRIDAIFFDAVSNSLFPMKTHWVSSSNGRAKDFAIANNPLFPSDCWLDSIKVPSPILASLVLSQAILAAAYEPTLRVRPVLFAIDQDSWNYQIHETTDLFFKSLADQKVDLDGFPRLGSNCRNDDISEANIDLEKLPDIPTKEVLNRLPVDRAARCYMILNYLWSLQEGADKLVIQDSAAIASNVVKRHLIVYPVDLLRHDIEDCLERGGFIERPRYERAGYAITASGVARTILMQCQLSPSSGGTSDEAAEKHILSPIRGQARLWADYKNGTSKF